MISFFIYKCLLLSVIMTSLSLSIEIMKEMKNILANNQTPHKKGRIVVGEGKETR